MTTNAELIVHGKTVHPARATCNCTRQLADALEASIEAEHDAERRFAAMLKVEASLRRDLEASQAQLAELSICPDDDASWRHYRACHNPKDWPADLLEAVHALDYDTRPHGCSERSGCKVVEARATLTRYGLLPAAQGAAPMEDAT